MRCFTELTFQVAMRIGLTVPDSLSEGLCGPYRNLRLASYRGRMTTPAQTHTAAARRSIAPLRSYRFVLAARTRSRGDAALIHHILEESPERAIQVCGQSHPDLRIVAVSDVTDRATAA